MAAKDIKLSEIPEEVTEDGLKIYGPASYETQVAILSQYLHTLEGKHVFASGENFPTMVTCRLATNAYN